MCIDSGVNLLCNTIFITTNKINANDKNTLTTILESARESITISGFRFSDIVSQVDEFYKDTANIKIPVCIAYVFSIAKMRGRSQDELDRWVVELRRLYNQ